MYWFVIDEFILKVMPPLITSVCQRLLYSQLFKRHRGKTSLSHVSFYDYFRLLCLTLFNLRNAVRAFLKVSQRHLKDTFADNLSAPSSYSAFSTLHSILRLTSPEPFAGIMTMECVLFLSVYCQSRAKLILY